MIASFPSARLACIPRVIESRMELNSATVLAGRRYATHSKIGVTGIITSTHRVSVEELISRSGLLTTWRFLLLIIASPPPPSDSLCLKLQLNSGIDGLYESLVSVSRNIFILLFKEKEIRARCFEMLRLLQFHKMHFKELELQSLPRRPIIGWPPRRGLRRILA